jgi:hypothetical protein
VAERKPFLLRIDPSVFEALQRWANDDLRSLNAQIEFVLRQALRASGRAPARPDGDSRPAATDVSDPS